MISDKCIQNTTITAVTLVESGANTACSEVSNLASAAPCKSAGIQNSNCDYYSGEFTIASINHVNKTQTAAPGGRDICDNSQNEMCRRPSNITDQPGYIFPSDVFEKDIRMRNFDLGNDFLSNITCAPGLTQVGAITATKCDLNCTRQCTKKCADSARDSGMPKDTCMNGGRFTYTGSDEAEEIAGCLNECSISKVSAYTLSGCFALLKESLPRCDICQRGCGEECGSKPTVAAANNPLTGNPYSAGIFGTCGKIKFCCIFFCELFCFDFY